MRETEKMDERKKERKRDVNRQLTRLTTRTHIQTNEMEIQDQQQWKTENAFNIHLWNPFAPYFAPNSIFMFLFLVVLRVFKHTHSLALCCIVYPMTFTTFSSYFSCFFRILCAIRFSLQYQSSKYCSMLYANRAVFIFFFLSCFCSSTFSAEILK